MYSHTSTMLSHAHTLVLRLCSLKFLLWWCKVYYLYSVGNSGEFLYCSNMHICTLKIILIFVVIWCGLSLVACMKWRWLQYAYHLQSDWGGHTRRTNTLFTWLRNAGTPIDVLLPSFLCTELHVDWADNSGGMHLKEHSICSVMHYSATMHTSYYMTTDLRHTSEDIV